jgi:molecular chaperone DnaK
VHVLQGERAESKSNRTLGKFSLDGVMPAPRGVPKIEVSFDIDANGILSVHAKDLATGKDQAITITASSGLSEADIQKMVTEAAEHEADDKTRREEIERRNKLDNLCYAVEKTLRDGKDKVAATDATALEALLQEGRGAVERQDDAMIVSVSARLEQEAHRVAAAMYQGSSAAGDAGGDVGERPSAAGRSQARASVVDAEFEDSRQHGHP